MSNSSSLTNHAERFFVKIAADFVRHRPEKLEATLSEAFVAGYKAGLFEAAKAIKSIPEFDSE